MRVYASLSTQECLCFVYGVIITVVASRSSIGLFHPIFNIIQISFRVHYASIYIQFVYVASNICACCASTIAFHDSPLENAPVFFSVCIPHRESKQVGVVSHAKCYHYIRMPFSLTAWPQGRVPFSRRHFTKALTHLPPPPPHAHTHDRYYEKNHWYLCRYVCMRVAIHCPCVHHAHALDMFEASSIVLLHPILNFIQRFCSPSRPEYLTIVLTV